MPCFACAQVMRLPLLTVIALVISDVVAASGTLPIAKPASDGARIVAIGDLHGDYDNCIEILRLAQVIDDEHRWACGSDTVIQMGDVVDRGPHGHSIMDFLSRLQQDAAAAGGEFIQLLGNHELMDWQGDTKFVNPQHVAAFGSMNEWRREWMKGSGRYGKRILELPVSVVRNSTLFIHGGLPPHQAEHGIEALNDEMHTAMASRNFAHALLGSEGPLWTRSQLRAAQRGDCRLVLTALDGLSRHEMAMGRPPVHRMVVGHTIQPNGAIQSFCNGALWAIDICVSQYMQGCGHLGYLEIRKLPVNGTYSQMTARETVAIPRYPPIANRRHRERPVARVTQTTVTRIQREAERVTQYGQLPVLIVVALSVALWRLRYNYRHHRLTAFQKKVDEPV